MSRFGPRVRTGILLGTISVVFLVAGRTQNIQVVLLAVALAYLGVAGVTVWRRAGVDIGAVRSAGFLLRRGGAWALIVVVLFVSLLVTQAFLLGAITVGLIYAAGILDQAGCRLATRST